MPVGGSASSWLSRSSVESDDEPMAEEEPAQLVDRPLSAGRRTGRAALGSQSGDRSAVLVDEMDEAPRAWNVVVGAAGRHLHQETHRAPAGGDPPAGDEIIGLSEGSDHPVEPTPTQQHAHQERARRLGALEQRAQQGDETLARRAAGGRVGVELGWMHDASRGMGWRRMARPRSVPGLPADGSIPVSDHGNWPARAGRVPWAGGSETVRIGPRTDGAERRGGNT